MSWDFNVLWNYRMAFLRGTIVTIELSAIMIILGTLLGILIGCLAALRMPLVRYFFISFIEVVRAVPTLVMLFWFHYPFQSIIGVNIDPFITSAIVLTLVNMAYIGDYIRSGIETMPKGQVEAAHSLGISKVRTFFRITLPEVIRSLLPTFVGQQVHMLKTTPFASTISVGEMFRVAQQINAWTYKTIEIYTVTALIFLAICLPLTLFARWLEKSKWFIIHAA